MKAIQSLSMRVGAEVTRRSLLRSLSAGAAGVGALIVSWNAFADSGQASTRATVQRGPDAGIGIEACGIFCSPVDCCPAGCCAGVYLFKCVSACDGSFEYVCVAPPCTGFCFSQAC